MVNINALARKIEEQNLSEIVSLRVNLMQKGSHYFGVCPFHEDHTIGSFSVNDNKHIAKCFSCGKGATSAAWFVSKVDNISYKEAVLRIGVEIGLITSEEALEASSQYVDYEQINALKIEKLKDESKNKKIAEKKIINLIYKVIASEGDKLNGGNDVLSKEHRKYLYSRGITDEDIKKNQYFTMPNRRAVTKIVKKLSAFNFKNEDLKLIPGFYYNEEKKFFTLKPFKGIGIPIKDIEKNIVGIQIRRDGEIKPGEQRYFWWSSANEPMGASPGSPIDINFPDIWRYNGLFITEGHFKANAIVKKYSMPAISVQGVGNWKDVSKTVSKMKDIKSILIAYDADMAYNVSVRNQAIKLGNNLKENFPNMRIYYIVWDCTIGKGIDDVIHIKDVIKKVDIDTFEKKCTEFGNLEGEALHEKFLETFNLKKSQ